MVSSDISEWPTPSSSLLTCYYSLDIFLTLLGISSNVVIISAILKVKSHDSIKSFYQISFHIAFCDVLKLTMRLMFTPLRIMNVNWLTSNFIQKYVLVLFALHNITSALFFFVFLAALNRFLLIMFPRVEAVIFRTKLIFRSIVLSIWVLIAIPSALNLVNKDFYYNIKTVTISQTEQTNPTLQLVQKIFEDVSFATILMVPVPYVAASIYLNRKLRSLRGMIDQSGERVKIGREALLIVQGLIFWLLFMSWVFIERNICDKPEDYGYYWPFIIMNILDISMNCCHPFIYMACNSSLREEVILIMTKPYKVSLITVEGTTQSVF